MVSKMLAKFLINGLSLLSLVAYCKSMCDCNSLELISHLCECIPTVYDECQVRCDKKTTLSNTDVLNIAETLPDKDIARLLLSNCEFFEFPDRFLAGKTVQNLQIWTSHELQKIGETTFAVNATEVDLDYLFELLTIDSRAFTQMEELVSLNIRGCLKLTTANFDFSRSPNLDRIVVQSTGISTMKRPILNKKSETKDSIALKLANNKLICDCTMIWVMRSPWWEMVDCVKPPRIYPKNPLTIQDFEYCLIPEGETQGITEQASGVALLRIKLVLLCACIMLLLKLYKIKLINVNFGGN